CQQCNSFPFTF
nr:immunoglobulin light chain junction region [Macaca mulatta]